VAAPDLGISQLAIDAVESCGSLLSKYSYTLSVMMLHPKPMTIDDILRTIFATNAKQVRHVGSFAANANLRSEKVNEFLASVKAGLDRLSEGDKNRASWEIRRNDDIRRWAGLGRKALRRSAESKGRGRPRGKTTPDTKLRSPLAAALSFMGCSKNDMGQFLYPENQPESARNAAQKFLSDHLDTISAETKSMTHELACNVIRSQVLGHPSLTARAKDLNLV
jgi:hypothetical protein